ncbi:MAG: hypothetical protein K8I02_03805, partial [Candidatus Methylomirabilis sp.]|nr:hypothetical protein [Deltaproteobacteria bacterium]
MHVRAATYAVALGTLFLGCAKTERPEPPAVQRDTALIDDDVQWTNPFIPGHRTTMDGRVAIRVQGGPAGPPRLKENLSFYLFVPEGVSETIMGGPPGAAILQDPAPYDVPLPVAFRPEARRTGHHAMCDPTEEFPVPGERPNPYPCGPDGLRDCYDVTIVSTTEEGIGAQLWGTPAHVEIEHPKTPAARIADVTLGESVKGLFLPLSGEWTEPAVTRDGRLLTGRYGRAPHPWTNPNTGETLVRFYDLMYSVLPEDAAPCDVTGWRKFHPISHAPHDPRMVGRYGLAAYPFRDSEGALVPDGEDVGGTYPWVDREGANVFMAGVPGRIAEQSQEEYPRRCVAQGCEKLEENFDWDRGFLMAGLWTHGKFVHLDGMINNLDWAVGVTPSAHYWVKLYRDASGEDVETRIGSGRFIDAKRYEEGPYPPGYTENANILDSVQNLLNQHEHLKPVLPRDVVWLMSTGVGTDEIVFDDYLDPRAFILSNMQASVTTRTDGKGATLSVPHYHNGQVRNPFLGLLLPIAQVWVLEPLLAEDIHVQNAATSLGWDVPAYGLVEAGTGRIEPTALGGVQGKGFWMTGSNEIRYDVPAQSRDIGEVDWYVSIFLDARDPARRERRLFAFPDGSEIRLSGDAVRYLAGGEVVH